MLLCVDVGNTQIALGLYQDAPDTPAGPLGPGGCLLGGAAATPEPALGLTRPPRAPPAAAPGAPGGVVGRPPLVRDWRMRTDRHMTADELEVAFRGLLGAHTDDV